MGDAKNVGPGGSTGRREAERRLAPLRLIEQDATLLREILPVIGERIDDIVDAFYHHLLDYEETRGILQVESAVRKLKSTLRNYLEATFNCTLERNYFEKRAGIGPKFNSSRLRPRFHLGTYSLLKRLIIPIVSNTYKNDTSKALHTMDAIDKVFFLDATFVIDSYISDCTVALEEAYKEVVAEDKVWEDTFNSITDLVCIHDGNLNIVRANKAVCKKFGTTEKEVVGKKCYEIFHGTDTHWPNCPLVKARDTLEPATSEIEDPHMGGTFLISAFPRFNEVNEFTGIITVAKDITEKKRLERELETKHLNLERLAVIDDLTGLFNRRRFYELLTSTMATSKRYGRPLSLLFFDLDNFKDYNDSYGHIEGDVVLREIARCVQRLMRQDIDFCCRYGGEEFTAILPETPEKGAFYLAERFRAEVERLEFCPKTVRGSLKPAKITVSVGVAEYKNYDADTFIGKADKAMYEAKKRGKNRVVTSG